MTIYNAYLTRRGVGQNARMPIHRLMVRDGAPHSFPLVKPDSLTASGKRCHVLCVSWVSFRLVCNSPRHRAVALSNLANIIAFIVCTTLHLQN
jgi:hypothetical protein